MSLTTRLADTRIRDPVVSKVDYRCSVLVGVSDDLLRQTSVGPQRCRWTGVLRDAF